MKLKTKTKTTFLFILNNVFQHPCSLYCLCFLDVFWENYESFAKKTQTVYFENINLGQDFDLLTLVAILQNMYLYYQQMS